MIKVAFHKYFELAFWVSALFILGFSHPSAESHFTLCPLKLTGIVWCPGCGLGHAIAYLLHGEVKRSFHAHWLGVPALLILSYRIADLLKQRFFERKAGGLNFTV